MRKQLLLLILLPILAISCTKGDNPVVAGKGGTGTLLVTPRHHTRQIDSCTIFIKYNAADAPMNGLYDDSVNCAQVNGIPVATFTGLKPGSYYLYGFGWDPTLSPPEHVKGGYAYPLQDGGSHKIDLAVSED